MRDDDIYTPPAVHLEDSPKIDLAAAGDLSQRFKGVERRLRVMELERIDFVQSMRLVLRSTASILRHRGFNNDLVEQLRLLESRLGTETAYQELVEETAQAISRLSGKVDAKDALWERDGARLPDLEEAGLKEALGTLVDRLSMFKNHRYQRVGETLGALMDSGATLESFLPVLVDLSLRFLKDYGNELSRISLRLTGIIRTLVFTEREYAKFLDTSIERLEGGNRLFNQSLSDEMGQIQSTVSEAMAANDPENLLGLVVEKIDKLFWAVQRKNQEDEERLGELKVEKTQLEARLDTVRRDYDTFVCQSHSILHELEAIKMISLRDQLTGAYNRRAYDEQLKVTLENFAKGSLSAFSLIIFDIDLFREVNNAYGHLAGDAILSNVARVVAETLRCDDFVFRYGGDEFIVLLPEASLPDAAKVAEKLRRQIEVIDFKLSRQSEQTIRVTISVGVSEAVEGDTATTVLARADEALYRSKNSGRNRVTLSR
jgi:diguanylate cyclase